MNHLCKSIEEYNPGKEQKMLRVFDDMIDDMISNKKLYPKVTKLFNKGKKLNISLVFITKLYFSVPNDVKLNTTHIFIMMIPNRQEFQQLACNHLADIDFEEFNKVLQKMYWKQILNFGH